MKRFLLLFLFIAIAALAAGTWIVLSNRSEEPTTTIVAPVTPQTVSSSAKTTQTSQTFSAPIGAGNHAGTEGPWARRILGAYSTDGLTWTKTNQVISDQADVPSLAIDGDGTLYLYYYGWTVGTKQNAPAVATSTDNGKTWTFHYLQFTGYPNRGDVSDPDVLYEDGLFRMYGTTRAAGRASILYGEGTDGIHFTYKSVAFAPTDASGNAGVASVYRVGDEWRLLSLASLGIQTDAPVEAGQHWYATSTNGATFTQQDTKLFRVGETVYFNGNVIPVEGGYRMYLFTDGGDGIRSWFSTDGETWNLEDGLRLALDVSSGYEKTYVGDPDIIQLPDGTYFMAYATLIPSTK